MKDIKTFKAFLSILMCADPSPITKEEDKLLRDFADQEAKKLGFKNWIDAYYWEETT